MVQQSRNPAAIPVPRRYFHFHFVAGPEADKIGHGRSSGVSDHFLLGIQF
jgi:hypothetical protein